MANLNDYFPFGVWESDDAGKRWKLDFNENGCIWIEKNAAGQTLRSEAALVKQGPQWKIERANTAAVLTFFGTAANAVGQILAQQPKASFMLLELHDQPGERLVSHWNGLRWTLKPDGSLERIEQPGSTPATRRDYNLPRVGNDATYYTVPKGQITFDSEGTERGTYHSRFLHFPGGASGVTLGRGYDMKQRAEASVKADLMAAGVETNLAQRFAAGAELQGAEASAFVSNNRNVLGNISPGQQKRLFDTVYQGMEDDVRRICGLPAVVQRYGAVDFAILSPVILNTLVDLRFRGDYTPASRQIIQSSVVSNDLRAFGQALRNRDNWTNVPNDRFQRRVSYLAANGG
jgi:hypothetical protein